jgi:hypothetical protein
MPTSLWVFMASPSDGRPGVLGFKIDECPTCHRTGTHLLTELVEKTGPFARSVNHRLTCTSCGSSVPVMADAARAAQLTGRLQLPRARPGFSALMSAGPRSNPGSPLPPSPYGSGDPEFYVSQQFALARSALAGGADRVAVERELFESFVPNPVAKPALSSRSAIPAYLAAVVAAAAISTLVIGFALSNSGQTPAQADSRQAAAVATPTPHPTPTARPTPSATRTPRPTPTPRPTLRIVQPRPTPMGGRGGFVRSKMAMLASYIPSGVVSQCRPAKEGIPNGATAAYACTLGDGVETSLDYFLLDDEARLDRAWLDDLAGAGLTEANEGNACWEGGQGEWSEYLFDEVAAGRVACFVTDGRAALRVLAAGPQILMRVEQDAATGDPMAWWLGGHPGPCRDENACW